MFDIAFFGLLRIILYLVEQLRAGEKYIAG